MKLFFLSLIIVVVLPIVVIAQKSNDPTGEPYTLQEFFPFVDGKVYYAEIIELNDNTPNDKLYTRAKDWIHTTFKSAKAVIDQDDRESGLITGEGLSVAAWGTLGNVPYKFKFRISVKTGKFRYELTDLKIDDSTIALGWENLPIEKWNIALNKKKETNRDLCRNIDSGMIAIGNSIKHHLSTKLRDEDF